MNCCWNSGWEFENLLRCVQFNITRNSGQSCTTCNGHLLDSDESWVKVHAIYLAANIFSHAHFLLWMSFLSLKNKNATYPIFCIVICISSHLKIMVQHSPFSVMYLFSLIKEQRESSIYFSAMWVLVSVLWASDLTTRQNV